MSDTVASLVWSTTPEIAKTLKSLPLEVLPTLINSAFTMPYPQLSPILALLSISPPPINLEDEIMRLTMINQELEFDVNEVLEEFPPAVVSVQPESVAAFPLKLSHADSYLGLPTKAGRDRRTVLVGDAAHTVHPMAGQGMNMGLGDVRAIVDTLERCVKTGGDVGELIDISLIFSLLGKSLLMICSSHQDHSIPCDLILARAICPTTPSFRPLITCRLSTLPPLPQSFGLDRRALKFSTSWICSRRSSWAKRAVTTRVRMLVDGELS